MARHERFLGARLALLIILLLGLGGCGGPKRFPPLNHGSDSPGGQVPSGVPRFLTVGLVENADTLVLAGTGQARLLTDGAADPGVRLSGNGSTLRCSRVGDKVEWSLGDRRGRAASVDLAIIDPAHRVIHGESQYRGDFRVICSPGQAGLTLINVVNLEAYLYGVVPWEIGRHGPDKKAALAAQAVAARTYTISHLGARQNRGFDVYASVMDQVYRGSLQEDPLCNAAVDATRGLILRHDGRPIDAYYSACCGGTSSRIQEVWPYAGKDYLKSCDDRLDGRSDPVCAEYVYFNWREVWARSRLEEILARTLPAYLDYVQEDEARQRWFGQVFRPAYAGADARRPGQLLDLVITSTTTSGRVAALEIRCQAGTYTVRGDRTRWVLERPAGKPSILRSAAFEVELTRREGRLSQVAVRGRGYGHGIGLCQAGALERARLGQDFRAILKHYYPGARLERIPTSGARP